MTDLLPKSSKFYLGESFPKIGIISSKFESQSNKGITVFFYSVKLGVVYIIHICM